MNNFIKKHSALLTALLINIIFLVLTPLIAGFHYEIPDDWFFSSTIADGHYNSAFCSHFIQVLSGLLQKIIYPLNAYIILQIFFGFVSFTLISYIFINTFKFKKGVLLSVLIEGIFAINVYSIATFTKTAAVLASAGGLLMLFAYHNNKKIWYSLFGILLVVLGSFYRFKIFYSVLAVFAFFILARILANTEKPFFKSLFKTLKKVLSIKNTALVLGMLLLVFALNSASQKIVYSTDEMHYYADYNSLRSKAVDYPLLPYNLAPDEYEAAGFSENDVWMLQSWHFDDEGFTPLETLAQIQTFQQTDEMNLVYLLYTFRNTAFDVFYDITHFTPSGIIIIAYLLIAVAILLIYKKKSFLYVGMMTFAAALLYIYLTLGGRINYRAVFSLWFAASICLIYCTQFLEKRPWVEKFKARSASVLPSALCMLVSAVFFALTLFVSVPSLSIRNPEQYPMFEEFVLSSDGKFFALSTRAKKLIKYSIIYDDPISIAEEKVISQCLFYGTAYYAHPIYDEWLAKANIDNLYTDIIDNDDIYFVDTDSVDYFITYLNEQYGSENTVYGYEFVANLDEELNIYKIVTLK